MTVYELAEVMKKRGYLARAFATADEAKKAAIEILSDCATIGKGGSATLKETGIWDWLITSGKEIYALSLAGKLGKTEKEIMKLGMTADAYICSANAVTEKGDIINIDGRGNRVAATICGPDKVVFVIGRNKITSNPHTAIARIKSVACPKNGARLHKTTPCALTGKCANCDDPGRMCNVTVRMEYPPKGREYHVLLIDGDYGY